MHEKSAQKWLTPETKRSTFLTDAFGRGRAGNERDLVCDSRSDLPAGLRLLDWPVPFLELTRPALPAKDFSRG